MIDEKTMRNFLDAVKSGDSYWYEQSRMIAKGLQYKCKIPHEFWVRCECTLFNCRVTTKNDLRMIREEVISAVVKVITEAAQKDCTEINDLAHYVYIKCRNSDHINEEEFIRKVRRVKLNDYFEVDHYTRYFRVLSILGVPKNTKRIPETTSWNYSYNIAYKLWKFDDGSEKVGEYVEHIAWYVSELRKGTWREAMPYRHH